MSKIDMTKQYKYAGTGEPARILCTDAPGPFPVISIDLAGSITRHSLELPPNPSYYSLVEITPYDDFEVDEPIEVSSDGKEWICRHFAKYENNKLYCWSDGLTSWSSKQNRTEWSTKHTTIWAYGRKPK